MKVKRATVEEKGTKEKPSGREDLENSSSGRENEVRNGAGKVSEMKVRLAEEDVAGKLGPANVGDPVAHGPVEMHVLLKRPPGLQCSQDGSGAQSATRGSIVCDVGGLTVDRCTSLLPSTGIDWRNANADFKAECDWRILSGEGWREDRSWRGDQKKDEEVMIQSLVKNPTAICVDSGAGGSVCPAEAFPEFETYQTDKVGNLYRAAGGRELRNVGEERPHFRINGIQIAMTFQATTHVKKPFAVASRVTSKGNLIVLDDEDSPSYIENEATGTKIPLKIENGMYVMEVAVEPKTSAYSPNGAPFQGRRNELRCMRQQR